MGDTKTHLRINQSINNQSINHAANHIYIWPHHVSTAHSQWPVPCKYPVPGQSTVLRRTVDRSVN